MPQRGLKKLIEEEQKKAAAIASKSNFDIPYDKHLQFLKFNHSNQPSPNSLPLSTVSLANNGAFDAGWHGVLVLGM